MTTAESPSANLRPQIGTVTDGEAIKTSSGVTSGDAKLSGVMGWAETKTFLSKVVAWPGDDPGYVNIHYSIKNKEERGRRISLPVHRFERSISL